MAVVVALFTAGSVSAHVSVQPKEVVAGYVVSSVRVPNEKDIATVAVRVVIPEGVDVHGVMPIAGWTHTEKREVVAGSATDGDDHTEKREGRITEVAWSGGKIAVGEFMEFPLSVQYMGDTDKVAWKAYQTYATGEVVPWDGSDEKHPVPVVTVLTQGKVSQGAENASAASSGDKSTWMSVAALLLSVAALAVGLKKK